MCCYCITKSHLILGFPFLNPFLYIIELYFPQVPTEHLGHGLKISPHVAKAWFTLKSKTMQRQPFLQLGCHYTLKIIHPIDFQNVDIQCTLLTRGFVQHFSTSNPFLWQSFAWVISWKGRVILNFYRSFVLATDSTYMP